MFPHPDPLYEQAKLQQAEWRRQAEQMRLAREAQRQSDRVGSSPSVADAHQIGQRRSWRTESALYRFLKMVFPLGTIEYLANRSDGDQGASELQADDPARSGLGAWHPTSGALGIRRRGTDFRHLERTNLDRSENAEGVEHLGDIGHSCDDVRDPEVLESDGRPRESARDE